MLAADRPRGSSGSRRGDPGRRGGAPSGTGAKNVVLPEAVLAEVEAVARDAAGYRTKLPDRCGYQQWQA
ncbi:hypothetical protein P3T27_003388 [Kitasatospora sp. MAA19]|uniref:hypothetical protein n=1 Tax=Kitasatospora sp. MAA19 TaxID=3035090 RepID=UPI002474FE52|nr:hypothetical protein [Kitasatospora sp. MAA19]MDH6706661.1 hypothetical protein [Kitasatospora sp. MAA19]